MEYLEGLILYTAYFGFLTMAVGATVMLIILFKMIIEAMISK